MFRRKLSAYLAQTFNHVRSFSYIDRGADLDATGAADQNQSSATPLSGKRHRTPLRTNYCMLIVCAESLVKLTENQVKMTTSIRIAMAACTMTIT